MTTTKAIYNQITKQYATRVRSEDLDHPFIERFLAILNPGDRVLDAGCGTGVIAHEMQKYHRLKVTGIDFSEAMIAYGKKHFPLVNFNLMDLRQLRFKSGSFKAIFANYSMIHILEEDLLSALKGFNRVLQNKGILYLALQSPLNRTQKRVIIQSFTKRSFLYSST